jgi:FAD synthase
VRFAARIIAGAGIASSRGVPTLNLDRTDVPAGLEEGIYACRVFLERTNARNNEMTHQRQPAVMHYGPRPVHGLTPSCEVHLLDQVIATPPASLEVEVVQRIREVKGFMDPEELSAAIDRDIEDARAILSAP